MVASETSDAAVYRELAPELIRFASALVGPQDAADVLSGAVVKALASPSWPTVMDHRPFLYRVVLNEARTWARRRSQRAVREPQAGRSVVLESPGLRPEIAVAVRQLSVRQRAVIVLTYWWDLDPASVAVRLGISEGSVRRHLARARAHLREVLDAERH